MKKILSLFLATFCCVAMTMATPTFRMVLSELDSVVTYYYDELAHTEDGTVIEVCTNGHPVTSAAYSEQIASVVIDPSVDDFRPTDLSYMFQMCTNLRTITGMQYLHTENVTNMRGMFSLCYALQAVDLSHMNTANVTNMRDMFENDSTLTSLDFSSFNTSKVTNMQQMFYECRHLQSLDLSTFNTSKVTSMYGMFMSCYALTSLDMSGFTGEALTNTSYMFYQCKALAAINMSSLTTPYVTDMSGMFYNCRSLASLNLSNFNTSLVTNMSSMFNGCSSLTYLDLSSFNTSNVTRFSSMFSGCTTLARIDAYFDNAAMTEAYSMFQGCVKLPHYSYKRTDFSGANSNAATGYFHMPLFGDDYNLKISGLVGTAQNFAIKRDTLRKDGNYNALCLPFALSADEIAASPLAGAIIKEPTAITTVGNDVTITMQPVTAIEARKPYFIKWENNGESITEMVFDNVTPTSDNGTGLNAYPIDLNGTFHPYGSLNSPNYYYPMANNTWGKATAEYQMKALSAYIFVHNPNDDVYNISFDSSISVVFDAQGLFANPATLHVEAGSHIARPAISMNQKGKVLYWSTDQAGTQHFDFENDVINSDITLYAQLVDFSLSPFAFDGNSVKWDYAAAMAPEINTVSAELLMANDGKVALEPAITLASKQLDLTGHLFSGVGYRFAITMNDFYGNVVRDTTAAYTVAGEYAVLPLQNLAVDANAHLTWTAPVPGLGKRKIAMYKYSANEQVWQEVGGVNELVGLDKGVVAPADYNFNRSLADGDYRFDVQIYQGSVLIAEGTVFSGSAHDTYYRIRFLNWDNTVLEIDSVEAGYQPVYGGAEPTRPDDEDNSYVFSTWTPALVAATADADYVATFIANPFPRYQIRFLNWDGSVLQKDSLKAGETPEYRGETPTKESDEHFDYIFTGWDKEIVVVTGPADYQALFQATEKESTSLLNTESAATAQKILLNGQVVILRDGKKFNLMGAEL